MSVRGWVRGHKWAAGAGAAMMVVVGLLAVFSVSNRVSPVGWGWYGESNAPDGLGLGGYDPVAYRSGAAKPGETTHQAVHNGVTWRFASQENRDAFVAAPNKHLPQFGSFCAFAVSKGFTADVDPRAYHVHDDKLYVFADAGVRDDFVAELEAGIVETSEANWSKR